MLMLSFNSQLDETTSIEVLDMLGRVVMVQQLAVTTGANNAQVSVAGLENGTYFVRIGQTEAQAFTVTR
jgi:flagellar hook assembly protein FlgD